MSNEIGRHFLLYTGFSPIIDEKLVDVTEFEGNDFRYMVRTGLRWKIMALIDKLLGKDSFYKIPYLDKNN